MEADHDDLIRTFAAGSDGRFMVECPLQEREGDEGPFRVGFIHSGRLYRFEAAYGDWYDYGAVHGALNRALATAGRRERFIAPEDDDQFPRFVFADPAAPGPFAERYGMALSDDPLGIAHGGA